jgi:ABC-type branched-subunit amino acid transport system substrate-binding protein
VGQPYLAAYSAVASQSGATLKKAPFATGATDFTAQVDQLKGAGVGVVLVAGAASALLPAMKTADSLGYTPKWIVTAYDTTPALLQSLPATQRLNMFFSTAVPLSGTSTTSVIDSAVQQYEKGIAPGNDTTVGWVTGSIFGAAFKKMTANGAEPTRTGLVAALNTFADYSNDWIKDITYTATTGVASPHVPRPSEAMIGFVNNQLAIVSPFTQPPKLSISVGQ